MKGQNETEIKVKFAFKLNKRPQSSSDLLMRIMMLFLVEDVI